MVPSPVASPLCTPSHSQQASLLPTPPPGPWIMSARELEDRRLACFASLVSAHPVVSEGAALGQPPHLGQTDKKLTFPPCLATTPTILLMERDLLPPLQGGRSKVWELDTILVPAFLGAAMGRLGKVNSLAWGGSRDSRLLFSDPTLGLEKERWLKVLLHFSAFCWDLVWRDSTPHTWPAG